jgi:hypothetical protein
MRVFPVTLITDPYCDWAPGLVNELFAVPTDLNHFWDTTSMMSSLIGLLVNGVFRELGAEVEARMARVSALYGKFIGHTVPGRNPGKPLTTFQQERTRHDLPLPQDPFWRPASALQRFWRRNAGRAGGRDRSAPPRWARPPTTRSRPPC